MLESFEQSIVPNDFTEAEATKATNPDGRTPRLSPARMYSVLLASDPAYNGRFFVGVRTTGIYCLPSCKARKPKRANVSFFHSIEAAREAGLRPCKKCHPDDFARGADPVLESIEALVAEVRSKPAAFADTQTMVRRSGFGATRLFELFRLHFHTTPADLLLHARLEATKRRLLESSETLASIAYDAGFESLSSFHENFRKLNGLTPSVYRALESTSEFKVELPLDYPLAYLRRALSRDPHSLTDRLSGDVFSAAVSIGEKPAVLTLHLSPESVRVQISNGSTVEAHALVIGLLGLDQDPSAFVRLVRRLGLARLVAGRPGLCISQIPSVFDGLLWAIIGQQINFAFACQMKRRLTEKAGTPLGQGLYLPPTPKALADMTTSDLVSLQFSRQKAEYVLRVARLIMEGKLELEALRQSSATRAERTLLALHGFGPWSVNYVMMRCLGFSDCVPLGDTGVSSGLQALLNLEERPDAGGVRRLMGVFSPFRSLATAHLWQFIKSTPI